MLRKGAKKEEIREEEEKVLNVDAAMQGVLSFKDPVNLCINGSFEGNLDTRGKLTIGKKAEVKADIKGEYILIAGRVTGEVTASRELALAAPARLVGNIKTPALSVEKGAVFQGKCEMVEDKRAEPGTREDVLNVEEVARYLEVDSATVYEWAQKGEIPAVREGNGWKFKKGRIEEWIASEHK